jgi:AhpD family alkylhydroperoxidase
VTPPAAWPPPQPDRDLIGDPEELAAYDSVVARFRSRATPAEVADGERMRGLGEAPEMGVYFAALLHTPRLAAGLSDLGAYYRGDSFALSPAEREWVVVAVGVEANCRREVYAHLDEAVRVGVRPEALDALVRGRDRDLAPDERELAGYVRAVLRHEVTAEGYERIVRRFGVRGAVELTAFVTHLLMAATLMTALGADHVSADEVESELARVLAAPPA